MEMFYVYCIVNKLMDDKEFNDFCDSQKSNGNILFITRDLYSNKTIIGSKVKDIKLNNPEDVLIYVLRPRKYYKAYININESDNKNIDIITDFIKFYYSACFIAITDEYIYFNIKDQNKFKTVINNNIENIEYKDNNIKDDTEDTGDIKVIVHPVYKQKVFNIRSDTRNIYDLTIKSKSNNKNISIIDILNAINLEGVSSIFKFKQFDIDYNTFFKIRTTDSHIKDKINNEFIVKSQNQDYKFVIDRIERIQINKHVYNKQKRNNQRNQKFNNRRQHYYQPTFKY